MPSLLAFTALRFWLSRLHDRLSQMGAKLIVQALDQIDTLLPEPQSETGVTYAEKIDKAEARINWARPAAEIDRQIRGLSPFPGAWTTVRGERVKLLASQTAPGHGEPGQVLDGQLTIACGTGAVRITRLQRAGKGAGDTAEVLRGWDLAPGDRMGD